MFFTLCAKSLWSRRGSVTLTVLAIYMSVLLMLGIEHIRHQTKTNFSNTVSGVDLIVGAPSGDVNLLLYTVFRIGSPSKNIRWSSFEMLRDSRAVAWAVPISLGDSHKGYRVLGTSEDYFRYFSYGQDQALAFNSGQIFSGIYDVVLGYDVANTLNYSVGDRLVLSHGLAETSLTKHDDKPFVVSGILKPTGTPVDQTLHVSLQGLEAVHLGWQNGAPRLGPSQTVKDLDQLRPKNITAAFIGLDSKLATFAIQRKINQFRAEPLQAILPGVALGQLWQMLGMMENTLRFISYAVFVAALLGLGAMLLVSIRERQREIAILRALGARPVFILCIIQVEALLITLFATVLAVVSLWLGISLLQSTIAAEFGVFVSSAVLSPHALVMLVWVFLGSSLIAIVPGIGAYSKILQRQLNA